MSSASRLHGLFFHVCFGLTRFPVLTLVGLAWENLYWKMIVLVLGEDYGIRRMKQCPGGGKCHEVLLAKAHSLQLPQGGVFL